MTPWNIVTSGTDFKRSGSELELKTRAKQGLQRREDVVLQQADLQGSGRMDLLRNVLAPYRGLNKQAGGITSVE